MKMVEIWENLGPMEKRCICDALNWAQNRIPYTPAILGLADIENVLEMLSTAQIRYNQADHYAGCIVTVLRLKGYKVSWRHHSRTDKATYTIEKIPR